MKFLKMILEEKDLADHKYGTYVGCKFSDESNDMIRSFMKENDIPNPHNDLHITVVYSKTPVPDFKAKGDMLEDRIELEPLKFDLFGEDKNVLVLRVESEELAKRNKYIMDEYGATSDYDEYKPHITFSYDVPEDFDTKELDKKIKDHFKEPIEIVQEYAQPLDPDYV